MAKMAALDRRRFLQLAGSTSLLTVSGTRLGWAAPQPAARFAYVGTESAIHVYSLSAVHSLSAVPGLRPLQTIAAAHPTAMVVANQMLYVANGISRLDNLPRGSVEAYTLDRRTGQLTLIQRVPLSLSGTEPRALAMAPDGRSLVVAIHGGGAYNILSIEDDGRLGGVTGIVKEFGAGPHSLQASAHPSAVVFDRRGKVLTADLGADRLSVFTLADGSMTAMCRTELKAGSGPSCIALRPDGKRVYVAHALDGSLSSFRYQSDGTLNHMETIPASWEGTSTTIAMHPCGTVLYSSHGRGLQTWKIGADESLRSLQAIRDISARALHVTADGGTLFALTPKAVLRMKVDPATLIPSEPKQYETLSNPASIVTV
jgi:6-phosphogluconolactonase